MGEKEILNVEQAAELLGFSPYTIREFARDGTIPAHKIGREWRFHRDEMLKWVKGECVLVTRGELIDLKQGVLQTKKHLEEALADKLDLASRLIKAQDQIREQASRIRKYKIEVEKERGAKNVALRSLQQARNEVAELEAKIEDMESDHKDKMRHALGID